ncbi:MAG: cobalamin biosynthesis protein CobD [Gammaproteobacteria bacterium]|nr:MAG: cobalamin biosynthesis protein CobD [Gammaproteobacteria bacterium]
MATCGCILLALFLDALLGEPKRHHPLVIFGNWAQRIETALNHQQRSGTHVFRGVLAWVIAVIPLVIFTGLTACLTYQISPWLHGLFAALVLYLAIGWRSLKEHMLAIYFPLTNNQLPAARHACSMIVSRNTDTLDETGIAKAAVESTLENGSDGIFAALFWFALLGAPGVVLYRLSNTLDAMWGYRTERFESFGKFAAKTDDLLNWAPAKITAWLYIANAFTVKRKAPEQETPRQLAQQAIINWKEQAPRLASPNGGPVMVTGATVLGVKLGGPTRYHGEWLDKPFFGGEATVEPNDIQRALTLIDTTLIGWVAIATVISALCLLPLHVFYG